ncbi:hypothetical protein CDAR_601311 [Caerostris darwini]|uniref:Uncharacterized protein n=1 Tax=Caerostris darwini TaxID=1538125 RepID=A0AAV4WT58_9ARAC|nr:hypothetical protein CDAR_601311 [Caerostris darwini]
MVRNYFSSIQYDEHPEGGPQRNESGETRNRRAALPAAKQKLGRRAQTIRANFTPPQLVCFPFQLSGSPPAARLSRLNQTPGVFSPFRGPT